MRAEHVNEVVRIADLATATGVVVEHDFQGCLVVGPAVLVPLDSAFLSCNLGGPDIDALFWLIPESRKVVVGAVAVQRCRFDGCRFENVGFAGGETLRMELGMAAPPEEPPSDG